MPTPLLIPIPVLVALTWLRSLEFLESFVDSSDINQRYRNKDIWVKDYAITATTITSRSSAFSPLRTPIIQVDVYGRSVKTSSGTKLPHNTCASIAELIADETYNPHNVGVIDIGGPQISAAKVSDISLVRAPYTENRSVSATLARTSLDIQLNYVPINGEI